MAVRRMIHKDIVCGDRFIAMSFAAQALFFQLQVEADEYGFVSGVRKIMKAIDVGDDVLAELIEAELIYRFDSGIVVMRDWDRANTRKNDRLNKIAFPREFSMLRKDENNKYVLSDGNQRNPLDSQRSLAELSGAQSSGAQQSPEEKSTTTASASSVDGHDDLRDFLSTIPWIDEEAWRCIQFFRRNMDDDSIRDAANQATALGAESFADMKRILYNCLSEKFTTEEKA